MPAIQRFGIPTWARGALFSGLAATIGVVVFWGFTVDDALITARVAHNLASGQGYRFNPSGPIVDAVTPLGWAHVLAPFAYGGVSSAFLAARIIGVTLWLTSAFWLGARVSLFARTIWPLAMFAWLAPVGLWASSGMETGIVTALVTFAISRSAWGNACLGLATAWRPELIPFAFVLALSRSSSLRSLWRDLLVVVGPSVLVAVIRVACFGSAYPLAVAAKPSDSYHGFWYALEGMCWSGPLWLWLAPGWPFRRPSGTAKDEDSSRRTVGLRLWHCAARVVPGWPAFDRDVAALALAILAHAAAVTLAGGDWMPAYRLLVPVMPAMLFVACNVPERGRLLLGAGLALAVLSSAHIAWKLAPSGRRIVEQRWHLVKAASAVLNDATVVAAPDVGWVGAAFDKEIVDLAGATDATIAYLRGGHTSKHIESRLFVARRIDRVIVLLARKTTLADPWTESAFARSIDHRAAMLASDLGCVPVSTLPLEHATQQYLFLKCATSH